MLLASDDFAELGLSPDPAFCEEEWGAEMCHIGTENIVRLTSPSLKFRVPEAWVLLQNFNINEADIDALLRKHPDNAASSLATVHDAACEWLNQSEAKWRPWVTAALEQANIKMNVTIGLLFPSSTFGEERGLGNALSSVLPNRGPPKTQFLKGPFFELPWWSSLQTTATVNGQPLRAEVAPPTKGADHCQWQRSLAQTHIHNPHT